MGAAMSSHDVIAALAALHRPLPTPDVMRDAQSTCERFKQRDDVLDAAFELLAAGGGACGGLLPASARAAGVSFTTSGRRRCRAPVCAARRGERDSSAVGRVAAGARGTPEE